MTEQSRFTGTEPGRRAVASEGERRSLRTIVTPLAIGIMLLGYVMMFQPFALWIFTYSYTVVLIGTALYIVASHLPE